ncbi:MAG: S-layer homology domain-containing protein [Peptoniphilus sp.]|nr:S-layer homology domain-containing protein [Peptoniphilus sp.]MDD7362728.1 S-layer homology domain-containing protein [Bacillota bacterium]MDY6044578.1 S-layer homology domain-containing protein [Peptoniphilus sp.]
MKKTKIFGVIACACAMVAAHATFVEAKTFSDVDANHWAYSYITELTDAGVLHGFPDGSFKPDRPVSLSETFVLIQGIKNPSEGDIKQAVLSYGDIAKASGVDDWALEATAYALEQNVITAKQLNEASKAGRFDRGNLTYPERGEIASYYARALRLAPREDTSNLHFSDADELGTIGNKLDQPVPLAGYVSALVEANIFSPYGSDGQFRAHRPIKRSEMAKITTCAGDYTPPVHKDKNVVIYTIDDCNYCDMAKVFMKDSLHTTYTEKNISNDPEAREEFRAKGFKKLPTIIIDDDVIVGYSPYQLLAAFSK